MGGMRERRGYATKELTLIIQRDDQIVSQANSIGLAQEGLGKRRCEEIIGEERIEESV